MCVHPLADVYPFDVAEPPGWTSSHGTASSSALPTLDSHGGMCRPLPAGGDASGQDVGARCDDVAVSDNSPSIRAQVWRAADPTGENRALINAAVHGGDEVPVFLRRVGLDVGGAWERLADMGAEYRRSIERIEASVRVLVPRGWAVMNMDTEAVLGAVQMTEAGRGDEADDLLAEQWEGEGAWRLDRICQRVRVMGATDAEMSRLFRERARLLGLAKEHHLMARYDASIPLLQAQLEGIAMDVTGGRKFFTKRATQKAYLVDPNDLASIEACLAALQATYGQDVKETQAEGSLSRHGVAHGRELAYDTRANSAKTWSVVDALVHWALPKSRELVAARRAERQARNAGSQEIDDRGRRVDDREIAETRDALRLLQTSAMGWYRQRGEFRDDLVGGGYDTSDFTRRGLPAQHEIRQYGRADGQEVMYWRQTTSGWVLGLALTATGEGFEEHLYAGPLPPAGPPSEGAEGWSRIYETPPDWA